MNIGSIDQILNSDTLARICNDRLRPPGIGRSQVEGMFKAIGKGIVFVFNQRPDRFAQAKFGPILNDGVNPLVVLLGSEQGGRLLARMTLEEKISYGFAPPCEGVAYQDLNNMLWMRFLLFGREELRAAQSAQPAQTALAVAVPA